MTINSNSFRVVGSVFNSEKSYIDVKISSISTDGTITFVNVNQSDESWEMDVEKLKNLEESNKVTNSTNLPKPKSEMWDVLDFLTEVRRNEESPRTIAAIQDAQEVLFAGILVESEDQK